MNGQPRSVRFLATLLLAFVLLPVSPALAERDASFLPPGSAGDAGKSKHHDGVEADPALVDAGSTLVNVAKRVTLIFENGAGTDAKVEDVTLSADGNVTAEIADNECERAGRIRSNDRCTVALKIMPNISGPWTAQVVLTHDLGGHVAVATVAGNTLGETGRSDAPLGLAPLGKAAESIDFGTVAAGQSTLARTALLVNDSALPLKVESVALIAAGKSLSLFADGCQAGAEVGPGASCPVTVLWTPDAGGSVSTDLIVRHTGPVGFVVIPVRGEVKKALSADIVKGDPVFAAAANLKALPIDDALLPPPRAPLSVLSGLRLKGTIGARAILATSEGRVIIAGAGEKISTEAGSGKLVSVAPDHVVLTENGKEISLALELPQPQGRNADGDKGASPAIGRGSGKSLPLGSVQSAIVGGGG